MKNRYRHFSAVHGVPATAAHLLKMVVAAGAVLVLLLAIKAVIWMPFEPGHLLGDTLFKIGTSLILGVLAILWAAALMRFCEEYCRPYLALLPPEKRRMGKVDAAIYPMKLQLQMQLMRIRQAVVQAGIRHSERQIKKQR